MMASKWHAVGALDEALNETVELLFRRFNLRFWLKLALIVFLVGGMGGGGSNFGGNWKDSGGDGDFSGLDIDWEDYIPLIIAAAAFFIFIALVFSFISSVASFVFIESVLKRKVEVIGGFKRHAEDGLKYFLFRLFWGVVTLIMAAAFIVGLILLAPKFGVGSTLLMAVYLVSGLILLLVGVILLSIISSFTADFVLLFMYSDKAGVIGGWRKLLSLIQNNFSQFLVYVLMKIGLGFIAAIVAVAASLVMSIFMVIVFVGVGFFAVLFALALGIGISFFAAHPFLTVFLIVLGVLLIIIFLMLMSYVIVFVTLPVPVFFRYYSILFFNKVSPEVNLPVSWCREKKPGKEKTLKKKKDLSVY